jgi:hypothetical protein
MHVAKCSEQAKTSLGAPSRTTQSQLPHQGSVCNWLPGRSDAKHGGRSLAKPGYSATAAVCTDQASKRKQTRMSLQWQDAWNRVIEAVAMRCAGVPAR